MSMTPRDLELIIRQGEGLTVEFKESRDALPNNVWESVCAFLNRQGGHLVLGLKDDGTITGVNPAKVEQLKKDFTNLSNNPTKLQPTFLMELSEVNLQGHILLYVYVPQSSQVHKCGGIVYDRKQDGDFKVNSDTDISSIYERKRSFYSESRILPYLGASAFKPGLLDRVRNMIRGRNPNHPWLELPDKDLMYSAGLWKQDFHTGEAGYTLAAALLLGKDEAIQSILPQYRIDAIVRRVDMDRYDDRLDIRTNLIEAYEQLMGFVDKHLPDKFFLDGSRRVSLRDIIFREVVANLIVHREYTNGSPARFIIYSDRVEMENANKPHTYGPLNPEKFSPYPKNPTIAKFFVQLGRVEELGSGIRNVTRALRNYAPGLQAQFIEEDVFRTVIPVPAPAVSLETTPDGRRFLLMHRFLDAVANMGLTEAVKFRLTEELDLFAQQGPQTATGLSEKLGVTDRTIRRDMVILRDIKLVELDGYEYRLLPTLFNRE